MDVDLSTDLDALLPLVAPLLSGHSDVAIGTRLARRVTRGRAARSASSSRAPTTCSCARRCERASPTRSAASRPCARDVAHALLPLVEDEGWFFDTELLVLAEHNGLRIHEVPVDWVDDPVSRVDIVRTAADDLRGVGRLLRRFARGDGELDARPAERADRRPARHQIVRFASIGVVSTVVFAVLFALLDGPSARSVPTSSRCWCARSPTPPRTARVTFALRGRAGRARHYAAGTALGLLPLVLTLSALAVLSAIGATSLPMLLVTLTAANALATVARFLLLRHWVFAP